ncbi:MAG: hypothetical protein ISS16_05485 [Ignavibacteria bacterium]|nr:hypothetical protein [Ignavibacteria bacterium]
MKITAKQIHEISEDLQTGMKVLINKETLEIKSILDWDDTFIDTEFWEEELEKIENEWTDYSVISKMESWEAFRIMEDFVAEITDERLKEDLRKILNRKSPFANFKSEIEASSYRQKWFDFRDLKYEDYVKEQLKLENFKIG